ncbi:IPT/TIG domain-containing protein, partial [bacterium]|nr:IPT/TIG domain-containing protein [bacterium]
SASIISYSPSSKITVDTGQSFTISTNFSNTGTTAAYFYAGASVWDSSGNVIFNDWGGKTYLNEGQQGSASWSHTINTPGEYWLQFGVWDEAKSELFDKKPSPSQNLIKVESTQLVPQVTGVDPYQPTANPLRQYITILGNNFVSGAQVTLQIISSVYPIPEDRTQFIDSTRIKVYVGLTDSGNWKVWITNPDGQKSNEYIFYVKP